MIHLVLQADRQQSVGLDRLRLAVQIEVAHDDMLGALDLVVDAGHREAAFLADLHAVALDELGIDQHQQLVPRFGGIDDDHPLVHIDLGRGQADARRFVHRLGHVARQTPDAVVNLFDRSGDFFQARIGKAEDW